MKEAVKKALMEIVGPDNYTEQLIDLISYAHDASFYENRPDCAVWPENTGQISQILALANQEEIPVVPRGAGTGLCGLAVPVKGGIVLDLGRMNRIISIEVPDRLVVVQPGVVYAKLQEALKAVGFFFPPDPASGQMCTIGGNVATNAGGLMAAKYGVTRDYVLGLEVVLADGEVMRTGGRTIKTSSGYDLPRLIVGSEGTLGVVTEITLKISPLPEQKTTAMVLFNRLEDAGAAITQLMHSGVIPAALEFLGDETIDLIRENSDVDLPPAEAILLVETHGHTKVDVDYQMERAAKVFRDCGAFDVSIAKSEEEALRFWAVRKSLGGMLGAVSPNGYAEDLTVPMSRITDYLHGVKEVAARHGLPMFNFGHAGDGNIHTNIMFDGANPVHLEKIKQIREELHQLTVDLGGTLSGEHGIGLSKAAHMSLEHDAASLRVMRAIKAALDPKNILNPGKMALDG